MFADREEAGRLLGQAVAERHPVDTVVIALPRGGVPVAVQVARALNAPLDLLLVRKIGAPGQPELAVGAVAEGVPPAVVVDERTLDLTGTPLDYVKREANAQLEEIERRRKLYLGNSARVPLAGRTVVLVDDGLATGSTVRAALQALRRRGPARIVLAVPVASADALQVLRASVDDVVPERAGVLRRRRRPLLRFPPSWRQRGHGVDARRRTARSGSCRAACSPSLTASAWSDGRDQPPDLRAARYTTSESSESTLP
jgi:putative phosphoribosyl transferase